MQLDVAALGWEDPCWDSFYPADLPEDWRLDYYANEFRAILLPAALYDKSDDACLLDWFAEAHPCFHFYLELNRPAQAERLLALLGEAGFPAALSGWLWRGELVVEESLRQLAGHLPGASWCSRPPLDLPAVPGLNLCWQEEGQLHASEAGLVVLPITAPPELRTVQQMIRRQQAAACRQLLVAVMPHPGAIHSLRQLHTLADLLNG